MIRSRLCRNLAVLSAFTFVLTLVFQPLPGFGQASNPQPAKPAALVSYTQFPLAFEPNRGQTPEGARFSAVGQGFILSLEKDRAVFDLQPASATTPWPPARRPLVLSLLGARPDVKIAPTALEPGVSNYIPSSRPADWRLNVPHYGRIVYSDIYPAIDLSFYGQQRTVEYDFRVKPGADSARIRIGITGSESARIGKAGDLEIDAGSAALEFLKPLAYQLDKSGKRISVPVDYSLSKDGHGWLLSFAVGAHDPARELIIDPVLSYGEQLATATSNIGAIASDAAGNVYITGQSQQRGFYIEKFNPSGTSLFTTVIGSGGPSAYTTGIAVDGSGNSYVTGFAGTGLPATAGAFLNYAGKHSVPFIAELAANGTTVSYLSYLGGTTNFDYSSGIALDSSNNIYITGYESSTDFPVTPGVYLAVNPNPGSYAAFAAKFDPSKSGSASLLYSTLLGAAGPQSYASGVAVDGSGDAYLAMQSNPGYPVTNGAFSYQGYVANSPSGAYLTKLNSGGTALVYSAYLGPGTANSVAVDTKGDAYITGNVYADDFPTTPGAYQTSSPGGFASELNPAGSALTYSTFLSGPSGALSPGSNTVTPQQIVIPASCASSCQATISGLTSAADFPAVNAIQDTMGGNPSAFLVELSGNGASAIYSTYLGGLTASVSYPYSAPLNSTPSVAIDGSGNAYLAANVSGYDFPSTLPLPAQVNEAYIAKIGAGAGASIVADPPAINFDTFIYSGSAVGVSSTLSGIPVPLVLRNLGSAPVAISSLTFTPNTEFSETDTCADAIPAGGVCTLDLAVVPTAAGKRTATLSIASNAITSPVTVALSGTAYASGYLQASTAELNFGDQALGTTSTQQTVTITNIGKSLVNLQPITATGAGGAKGNGADFKVLNNCPAQLLPGANCTVGVTFTPLEANLRGASFYLQGDGFGNQYVYLYGTGINGANEGTLSLSATTLNFNTQLENTVSPAQGVTLINTTASPISISSVSIGTTGEAAGSDFFISSGSCVNTTTVIQVAPQATCTISVRFQPTTAAAETGIVKIYDSTQGSPHTVALSGVGLAVVQALEFTPGNLVYPDQPVGIPTTGQQNQTFYVYNTSTAPVTIGRVLVSGDFQVASTNCPGNILKPGPAPGVDLNFSPNCRVTIGFTPTATGVRNGALTLQDNAGGTPQVLNLIGNGITATGTAFIEPSSLVFGKQAQGTTSATQHVAITNPGNSPIQINNITTTGDYAIVNICTGGTYPYLLRVQGTCGVDLSFTPTSATNPNTGSLVVSSSAGTATLPVSGTGVAAVNAVGITPTALNFGSVQTGATSFIYTVYFRNTGSESATLTSAGVSGDYNFSYGSCQFSGNQLAPGASCYVQVSFSPTAAGTRTGTLTLNNSAGNITASLTGTGSADVPLTAIVPNGVSFDQVPVGSISTSNVNVTFVNHATTSLTIKTAKISAGGSAFLIPIGFDNCSGSTLNQSGSCNVQVEFSPATAGYLTGTLTFTDAANKAYSASLAGYSPAVSTSAYLDPTTLAFPGQVLTTYSSSQTINLINTSDVPLTVGTLSGTNTSAGSSSTGAFSVNSNGGSDGCSSQIVAPRSRCSVGVIFGPATAGSASGTLVFPVTYANASTGSFTANLSGTGTATKDSAELSPTSLHFADQAVNAVPGAGADSVETITLYNTSNLPITVGIVTGTDTVIGGAATGDFTTAGAFGGSDACHNLVIAPGSYCQEVVAFNPASAGAKSGTLSFPLAYADNKTATLTATLSGKGIADGSKLTVSPASGQFDVQVVNTTSDSSQQLTFNLTNNGNLPIAFKQSSVTAYFFFVTDSCSGTTLGINSSCSITLSFTPRQAGPAAGTLTIHDDAAGNPHKVSLSGTGISAEQQIVLSQSAVKFGNQVVNTKSGAISVYVSNQSGNAVPIGTVVLSGANASDFIENDSCSGQSLSGHGLCAINVQFAPAPASLGLRTATVTETDSAAGSPHTIALSGMGIASAPAVTFYPANLNFGSQGLNTASAPLAFSVTNTGSTNLTIKKVASTNATEFKVKSQTCTTAAIVPGGSCLVGVVFEPNAGSTQTGTIAITDDAAGSPQSIAVTGLSVGIPQATLKPVSLTFASQPVGSSSAAQIITLSNGGTDTLKISSIGFTGTNPVDFSQTNTCGTSIVAGADCTISVVFKPVATGSLSATLTVTDNAGNVAGSTQTAAVSGTGTGVAKIAFKPVSLTFAATDVGSSSAVQKITVSNPGTAPLSITGISVVPTGDYTQTNTCGNSLDIAATCTISVTFSPGTAGKRTAAISVADNAANAPQTVALTGTAIGVAKASLSTATLNFNNQAVGIVSGALPVTVTNTGSGPLIVASFKLSGANAGDFTATSTACPGTLAIQTDCVIDVTFKPAAAGARSATLTITDNTGNVAGSTQAVTLSGTGIGTPGASLNLNSIPFGSQSVGTSTAPGDVILTNTGNGPLTITSIAAAGANAADFLEFDDCPISPSTLAVKATCEIAVVFSPRAAGSRSGSVVLTDNAGGTAGATQTISLTGTGTGAPEVQLSASSLTFAATKVGSQSNGQAVTLTNSGNIPLSVASVVLGGANAGDFSAFNSCTPTVNAGDNCVVAVFFKPTATGTRKATVTITDNAGNVSGTTQAIQLTGTGN